MSLWTIRRVIRWLQGWRPADSQPDNEWRIVWGDGATFPALAFKHRGTWWTMEEDDDYIPNVMWVKSLPKCPYE